jgi:hypothetical protein
MKTKYLKKFREQYYITETVIDVDIRFERTPPFMSSGAHVKKKGIKVKQKEYKVYRGLDFIDSFKGPVSDIEDTWIDTSIREHGYEDCYNKRSLRFAIDRAKELFISSVYAKDKRARKSIDNRKKLIIDKKERESKKIRDEYEAEIRDKAIKDISNNKIKWD